MTTFHGSPKLIKCRRSPPIVHEVLRSPGQPLDPATCAFMEPRFGHGFSNSTKMLCLKGLPQHYRNDSARGAANAFYLRLKHLLPVHLTDFDIAEETSDPLLNLT